MNRFPIRLALVVVGLSVGAVAGAFTVMGGARHAALFEDVQVVTWMDLMPDGAVEDGFAGPTNGPKTEAEWLEQEAARASLSVYDPGAQDGSVWALQPQPNLAAEPRADLDGTRIALAGYMTPLDFEARETQMFLLVPYVGACIHVPAPPPNQIILVQSTRPVPVLDMWQPFTAVGTLRVERLDTGLAQSAYVMDLDRMVDMTVAGGPEEDYTAGAGEMQ